jgi:hypothetical protein
MRLIFLFYLITTSYASANGQSYFPVPDVKDTMQFRNGIARTAWLLTSATKVKPNKVRILVYGQSISEQAWWKEVKAFVEKNFPLQELSSSTRQSAASAPKG